MKQFLVASAALAATAHAESETPYKVMRERVNAEFKTRVQIHDAFAAQEKEDVAAVKRVKSNRNLVALIQTSTPSSVLKKQIAAQRKTVPMLSDAWKAKQQQDIAAEKKIKANKNLKAMFLQKDPHFDFSSDDSSSHSGHMNAIDRYVDEFSRNAAKDANLKPHDFSQDIMHSTSSGGNVISIPLSSQLQTKISFLQKSTKMAPNVRERVRQGRMWDVYLGDSFKALEKEDKHDEKRIKSNPSLGA